MAGLAALSFSTYSDLFRSASAVLPSARSMRGSSENNSGRLELRNCLKVMVREGLAAPGACVRNARRSTQRARLRA